MPSSNVNCSNRSDFLTGWQSSTVATRISFLSNSSMVVGALISVGRQFLSASALAAEAEILLFDEPTSGLDYRHMREVAALLKELAGKGKTVFVSTHDPELVAECCDRLIRIADGYAYEIT